MAFGISTVPTVFAAQSFATGAADCSQGTVQVSHSDGLLRMWMQLFCSQLGGLVFFLKVPSAWHSYLLELVPAFTWKPVLHTPDTCKRSQFIWARTLRDREGGVENKVTRMMRVEAPRQFLPNVRSSGLAFRLALAKG